MGIVEFQIIGPSPICLIAIIIYLITNISPAALNWSVSQGSVLGPLLVLLYVNEVNQVKTFCKVYHFADDTNVLSLSNSVKKLNKLVIADLKHLVNWLNTNKFFLNFKKLKL